MKVEEEFLKSLPAALNLKQRLIFETISFSVDTILIKYNFIVQRLALYNHESIQRLPQNDRIVLFSDLWSMIDQAHNICQMLYNFMNKNLFPEKGMEKVLAIDCTEGDVYDAINHYYKTYYPIISGLRNKMDHLETNINNLSKMKKPLPPVYGALSYLLSSAELLSESKVHIICLTVGAFTHDKHHFQILNLVDYGGKLVVGPIDCMYLNAFDWKLKITELFRDTVKLKQVLNIHLAKKFNESITTFALEHKMDPEELLKHNGGAFTASIELKTNEIIKWNPIPDERTH